MNKKTALFIGRFQPLHFGHLEAIRQISREKDIEKLIIGIGSSQESFTSYNPFTVKEREEMLLASLKMEIPFEIQGIPDFADNDEWTKELLEKYFKGEVVYSGNPLVIKLLTEAGLVVKNPPHIDNPSATEIRRLIIEGKGWEKYVPDEVQKIIKQINGIQRLKDCS